MADFRDHDPPIPVITMDRNAQPTLLMAYGRLRADGVLDAPLVISGKPDIGAEAVVRRAKLSMGGAGASSRV